MIIIKYNSSVHARQKSSLKSSLLLKWVRAVKGWRLPLLLCRAQVRDPSDLNSASERLLFGHACSCSYVCLNLVIPLAASPLYIVLSSWISKFISICHGADGLYSAYCIGTLSFYLRPSVLSYSFVQLSWKSYVYSISCSMLSGAKYLAIVCVAAKFVRALCIIFRCR